MEGNKDSSVSPAQQGSRRLENEYQIGITEDDGDNDDISAQLMNQKLRDAEDDKDDDQETIEQEEKEEEYEEIENRGCSLRGFVKFLLLLIAIMFSISYMWKW